MTRIIESLAEISAPYDALYCDLWGCLHNGITPFPAAVAALRSFRNQGGRVVLMTNAPRPSSWVMRSLDSMGLPRDCYDMIVSSGDAAQAAMVAGAVGYRIWHIGPEKDDGFFTELPDDLKGGPEVERVDLAHAEGIVCTGPFNDATETPDDYRASFLRAKAMGLKLLCANPDIVVDQGDTRLYCAGALAQLYDEMGGESLYYGKPHPPIYDLARGRLAADGHEVASDRILALGDGIATDVQGAIGEDIDVVFITGGIAAGETGTARQPDPAQLKVFLDGHSLAPTYAMGFLR